MVLGLVGCGTNKIPFTHPLKTRYQFTPDELHRLQYYVSEEAVLRKLDDAKPFREVKQGTLFTKSERRVDDVILRKDTPGILVDFEENKPYELSISFEQGTSFPFGAQRGSKYSLKGRDALGRRRPFVYKGTSYFLTNEGKDVHLLIRKEDLAKLIQQKKVLPGRKVGDSRE